MSINPAVPSADEFLRAFDTLDFLTGMVEAESLLRDAPERASGLVPVIIVSGFLGSGKTTLMRRLVTGARGRRITAIVNDVAALDIDAALVAEVADETIALADGCVCCSLAGSVARTLVEATARSPAPEAIVIEASGVADPYALAQVASSLPGLAVDGVVTVVDALTAHQAAGDYLMRRQVAAADLILLNKIDLVRPFDAEAAHELLSGLAPRAQLLRTVGCAVPAFVVFDVSRSESPGDSDPSDPSDHALADARFHTLAFHAPRPVDRKSLEDALLALPAGIVRAKGLLTLSDAPDGLSLLQLVGRRWRWEDGPTSSEGRLVVIGAAEGVDWQAIAARFVAQGFVPAG